MPSPAFQVLVSNNVEHNRRWGRRGRGGGTRRPKPAALWAVPLPATAQGQPGGLVSMGNRGHSKVQGFFYRINCLTRPRYSVRHVFRKEFFWLAFRESSMKFFDLWKLSRIRKEDFNIYGRDIFFFGPPWIIFSSYSPQERISSSWKRELSSLFASHFDPN